MSNCINPGHDPKYPCSCGTLERVVSRRNDGFDDEPAGIEAQAGIRAGALASAWAVIGALLVAFTLILMKWGN